MGPGCNWMGLARAAKRGGVIGELARHLQTIPVGPCGPSRRAGGLLRLVTLDCGCARTYDLPMKWDKSIDSVEVMARNCKVDFWSMRTSPSCMAAATMIGACLSVATTARAQTGFDPLNGMLTPLDAYGNVQAYRPESRALDIYQNDAQRMALSGYQDISRRLGQRGYGIQFALPGDLLAATVNRYTGAVFLQSAGRRLPTIGGYYGRDRRSAFNSYGGFGQRHSYDKPGDPAAVFSRRQDLIMATGLNAPVERAMGRSGALRGLRWSVSQTPFLASEATEPDANQGDETIPKMALDERLSTQVDVLHARTRAEAWAFFRDADYRRAMRLFETAAMLDPTDMESRIGEIFSHVTIGSVRTAYTLVLELDRRDLNPFQHELNLADRYGSVAAAQQVRFTAQEIAETTEQSADANALYVFVLWYIDRRDDALRASGTLAARAADRSFAAWPDKMRTVMAGSAATTP